MVATRKKETVQLMFSCCACTPKVKLNTDRQIEILSKFVCVVNEIASIATLHWVNNFWLCKKYKHLLVKKDGLPIKNVSLRELEVWLVEICKNRKLSKLGILLE